MRHRHWGMAIVDAVRIELRTIRVHLSRFGDAVAWTVGGDPAQTIPAVWARVPTEPPRPPLAARARRIRYR